MPDQIYMVRDDLSLALPEVGFSVTPSQISKQLSSLLQKALPAGVVMSTVKVEDQLVDVKFTEKTISLDCFWSGTYNLQVTRLFHHNDGQSRSLQLTNRPGTPDLTKQIALIPAGEYILVDDDISTGWTMQQVTGMLAAQKVNIVGTCSLIEKTENLFDVVDLRDFILGTYHGGLTVKVAGKITRLPYMQPYVNLVTRAKLTAEAAKKLTSELWQLNHDLYSETGVKLGDIEKRQAFTSMSFNPEMSVKKFCDLQLKRLRKQGF